MTAPTLRLALDGSILDAEATVRDLEKARGLIPAQAARPMTEAEIRSRCDFAAIDQLVTRAYERTAAALRPLKDSILESLSAILETVSDPRRLVAEVLAFAANQPPEVKVTIAAVVAELAVILGETAGAAGAEVAKEAAAQGVAEAAGVSVATKPSPFKVAAQKAPAALWAGLAAAAVNAAATRRAPVDQAADFNPAWGRTATADDILAAVREASTANAEDLARQEVNIAHGDGRARAITQLPEPAEIYASELLDGATCPECFGIDGKPYESVNAAHTDYPDDGPYRNCRGGDRCRGTLVYVWDEQPATLSQKEQPRDSRGRWGKGGGSSGGGGGGGGGQPEKRQLHGSFAPKPPEVKRQLTGSFAPKPAPVSQVKQLTGSFAPKQDRGPAPAAEKKKGPPAFKIGANGRLVPNTPPKAAATPDAAKPAPKQDAPKAADQAPPKSFKSDAEGRAWASKKWPDKNSYSKAQQEAARDYTDEGYHETNKQLRESKGAKGANRSLDSAINKAPRVPERAQVTRGTSLRAFGLKPGDDPSSLVGTTHTEHGYMSTSLGSDAPFYAKGNKKIMMKVNIPKGKKAIYLNHDKDALSTYGNDENELLLSRGTRYTVRNVQRKAGQWHLEVDVLPDGD